MKNRAPILATVFAAVLATPALASAQAPGHNFGLGLQLGDPGFAFGAKYFFDYRDAIQGTIGWRGPYYYHAQGHGPLVTIDWQHRVGTVGPRSGKVRVSFDVGVGGAIGFIGDYCVQRWGGTTTCYNGDAELALRVPLAVSVYFPIPRLEAYVEVAPSLVMLPFFGPDMMGGIGGRFYF